MKDSSIINLSDIPRWYRMTHAQAVDYLLDNNITQVKNDFGAGIIYELADLEDVWEDLKPFNEIAKV